MLTLLFVHLGTKPPKYLTGNILRTRDVFPNIKIVLLTDSHYLDAWGTKQKIEIAHYSTDQIFQQSFTFGEFDKNFRKGYWQHTIERLFAINFYHQLNPTSKLLHIESDVILMPNFPLDEMIKLDKVAWLQYGPNADIAALVYSPSPSATQSFHFNLLNRLETHGGSDMQVLFGIRKKFSENYLTLPLVRREIESILNPNIAELKVDSFLFNDIITEGIFDAFGIGVWLFGFDPRNRYGITTVHTREVIDSGDLYIDASKADYSLTESGNLYMRTSGNRLIPIYNLHVHSKNLRLLSPNWLPEMTKFLEFKNTDSKVINFQPWVLIQLIVDSLRSRNFLDFLLQSPPGRFVRRFFRR